MEKHVGSFVKSLFHAEIEFILNIVFIHYLNCFAFIFFTNLRYNSSLISNSSSPHLLNFLGNILQFSIRNHQHFNYPHKLNRIIFFPFLKSLHYLNFFHFKESFHWNGFFVTYRKNHDSDHSSSDGIQFCFNSVLFCFQKINYLPFRPELGTVGSNLIELLRTTSKIN